MLRLWMMFPLAAAFRSSIGDGDEMCCCYKKKKAFSGICVKDGIAYQTLRSRDEDKFDFVNRTVDFVTYSTYFDQDCLKGFLRRCWSEKGFLRQY
eukprot:Skav204041  [mRNA]  locus=scaffold3:135060:138183:- [translate_table: standard]